MKVFLAGATGVIGQRLVPMLLRKGHEVTGISRSRTRAAEMTAPGLTMVVADAFDADAMMAAMVTAQPEIVIHQLTDLAGMDPSNMAEALERNARLRRDGTRNLVAAAEATGVRRVVAQSIAWIYAPGPLPHVETDSIDVSVEGAMLKTVEGVIALEGAVLGSPSFEGIVLRYGWLYGRASGTDVPYGDCPVHVDAAADAALLALTNGHPGIYNITEPNASVSSDKAIRELGWNSQFRSDSA